MWAIFEPNGRPSIAVDTALIARSLLTKAPPGSYVMVGTFVYIERDPKKAKP